jgi:hypothetical protein
MKLKYFFEKYGFHVLRLADSLGMRVVSVRLFFYLHLLSLRDYGFGVYLTLLSGSGLV